MKEDNEWFLSGSEPIRYLDIRYEHASGGTYSAGNTVFTSPANPIGMGWYPAEFLAQCDKIQLPAHQIESPDIRAEYAGDNDPMSSHLPLKLFGLVSATEIERQHVLFNVPVENLFVFIGSGLGFFIPKNLQPDTVVVDMNLRKVFCTYCIALPESLNIAEMTLRHIPDHPAR